MKANFSEFMDKKQREGKRHLGLVGKILEKQGFSVENFLEEEDPYVFIHSPKDNTSFNGVRVYKIGNMMAFRVQKESKTHPYGNAYELNLEEIFNDYISDDFKDEEAAKKVMEAVTAEIKGFFKKSSQAEDELRAAEIDKDGMGKAIVRSTGTDYSNMVHSKM